MPKSISLSVIAPFAILALASFFVTRASAEPGALAGGGPASPGITATEATTSKPAQRPIAISLRADINLSTQRLTVSSGGKVLHIWPISSGARGYETPRGTFRPQWTARMWFSKKYDNAPMPHSVFFNGGIATHATHAVNRLGTPASHGCIRLPASGAAIFYALVLKHGLASTRIVVHGSPRFREEVASRRELPGARERALTRRHDEQRYYQSYGYLPTSRQPYATSAYGYSSPRRYDVPQRPIYGQMRYLQSGYARY